MTTMYMDMPSLSPSPRPRAVPTLAPAHSPACSYMHMTGARRGGGLQAMHRDGQELRHRVGLLATVQTHRELVTTFGAKRDEDANGSGSAALHPRTSKGESPLILGPARRFAARRAA